MNLIYHNRDLDGYCSAAIVKKWYNKMIEEKQEEEAMRNKGSYAAYPELKLIGWDYGRPIPELDKQPVIMVDVSFSPEEMLKVAKNCNYNLTWIDHHVSAINAMEDFIGEGETFLKQYTNTAFAACELVWEYYFGTKSNLKYGWMPFAVKLLGQYDSWRNDNQQVWDEIIMPFQYGMRAICNSVDTFPMELLTENAGCEELITSGKALLKYQKQQNSGLCRITFEKMFKGLRAICLNASGTGSQTFESVWDENKYDIMISFFYNGDHDFFTVSLYSTKPEIDCSVLAKSMGGGGHKGAAGFQVNDFKTIFDQTV